ncbi:ECF transporter S component [Microbacterium sp.]|uniref:ECF transporter S component n=1 Tax=Microbacterium sp. TaxID=51671 RepID=UPI003C773441
MSSRRYTTRTILTAAALGAAVGVLMIPLNFAQNAIVATMPIAASAVYGIWGMAAMVPLALLRRGGVGVIGAAAAGIVNVVSPFGALMVLGMLMWGAVIELPFLLTRYRRWGWPMFVTAGIVAGVLSCASMTFALNLQGGEFCVLIGVYAAALGSFVGCSLLSLAIARALARTGITGGRTRRPANA